MNQPRSKTKTRSWRRFSLRFLMMATLIAGLGFAWLASQMQRANREAEIFDKLSELGPVSTTYVRPKWLPWTPVWLDSAVGENTLARLKEVEIGPDADPFGATKATEKLQLKAKIGELTSLEAFAMDIYPWEDLDQFQHLTELKALVLDAEPKNIDGIKDLKRLERLDLGHCWQLQDISPIKNLSKLKVLSFAGCPKVVDLSVFKNLNQLETLDLPVTYSMKKLNGIEALPNLVGLRLRQCSNLNDINGIETASRLKILDLESLHETCNFDPLKTLTNLITLDLSGNKKFDDLSLLSKMTKMEHLYLNQTAITDLDGLQHMKNLTHLSLSGCGQLEDISAVYQLKSLINIDVSGCPKISQDKIDAFKAKLPTTTVSTFRMF